MKKDIKTGFYNYLKKSSEQINSEISGDEQEFLEDLVLQYLGTEGLDADDEKVDKYMDILLNLTKIGLVFDGKSI